MAADASASAAAAAVSSDDAMTTGLCDRTPRPRPVAGEDDVWIYKVLGVKPHVLRLSRPRLLLRRIR